MSGPIRTAFVLGAGLGTRLRPLTLVRPKPLLPIFGKPLITFALDHLRALGVESFVINTHHLAEQFDQLFVDAAYGGCSVKLVHEPDLLETGGGIKNAERWIGREPFIVYSGDILTDIVLEELVEEHVCKGNDVTLALRRTGLASGLSLDAGGRVVGIETGRSRAGAFDFANVSIWSPAGFQRMPAGRKISFVPILAEWLREGGRIGGVVLDEREWFNIGSRKDYLDVHRTISEGRWRPAYLRGADWPVSLAAGATVAPTARLSGFNMVGPDCVVEAAATLEDCILWSGAMIQQESILRSCVVAGSLVISGRHENIDFTAVV
ncbi:MAG TPA: sugar phosphate nucleotidyltransferase [Terrimicrobiaceae bacterium]